MNTDPAAETVWTATVRSAHEQTGRLAEDVRWLAALAADIDDRQLSELVHALNRVVWMTGERLTRLRK